MFHRESYGFPENTTPQKHFSPELHFSVKKNAFFIQEFFNLAFPRKKYVQDCIDIPYILFKINCTDLRSIV
jgi:hypothetical protein